MCSRHNITAIAGSTIALTSGIVATTARSKQI